MPKIKWILKKFSKTFKILPKWQNFAKSGHTVMMIDLCMEHFSRRTWTTRSAQQPSLHGIIPCKCYIFCMVLSFLQHSTTWADKTFNYLKSFMTSVTSKKMQNDYIKVAQKWLHYKTERFQTPLQKWSKNVGNLGKIIVATGFEKIPQSPINRPIWSHCSWLLLVRWTSVYLSFALSWFVKAYFAAFSCNFANLFSNFDTFFSVGFMNFPFMSLTVMFSSLIWNKNNRFSGLHSGKKQALP